MHLFLIAALGLIAYSNTFDVPFQWDDKYTFLSENPVIKDLRYFSNPSKAKDFEQYYFALRGRYVGYLTFALNYKFHGLDVTGYHIVNTGIHLINAMLVYMLVSLTFKTPFLNGSSLKGYSQYIALFTGLLFVSHPIQTEAVTYIFQRLASLAAFFYLLSIVLYIKWRLTPLSSPLNFRGGRVGLLYLLSLLSAVLAMKTKENTFTLPIVLLIFELSLFNAKLKKQAVFLVPFFLTMLIIPLTLAGGGKPIGETIGGLASIPRGAEFISRGDYLITQFRVITTYIRLMFFPVNQNIYYDYKIYNNIFDYEVLLSAAFFLAIGCLSVRFFLRSSKGEPALRLLSLGLIWFFATLSVESSVIPLPKVINEYRLYLPSIGFFVSVISAVFILLKNSSRLIKVSIVAVSLSVVLIMLFSTYKRNMIWRSEISLWEDTLKKSPFIAMVHNNLALAYLTDGLTTNAIEHLNYAISLDRYYDSAYMNLGNALIKSGLEDKAYEQYNIALKLNPGSVEALTNVANIYLSKGLFAEAIDKYLQALKIEPYNGLIYFNVGTAYASMGQLEKAIENFNAAIRLNPDDATAHNNLGNAYFYSGLYKQALEQYNAAIRLSPGNTDYLDNLSLAYGQMRQNRKDEKLFKK